MSKEKSPTLWSFKKRKLVELSSGKESFIIYEAENGYD